MYNRYIYRKCTLNSVVFFFVLFNVSRTLRKIYLENLDCIRYYFVPENVKYFY